MATDYRAVDSPRYADASGSARGSSGLDVLKDRMRREQAARGMDERTFPWGNSETDETKANSNRNEGGTTPVGNYPLGASPYGALDMAGNVWEWTAASEGSNRVLRGGSWLSDPNNLRASYRGRLNPGSRHSLIGFRCAR